MANAEILDQSRIELDDAPNTEAPSSDLAQHLTTSATLLAAAATLTACGGGGEDTPAASPANNRVQPAGIGSYGTPDAAGAWRFLQQASMGGTEADIKTNVIAKGYEGWLSEQMAIPYSNTVANKAPAAGTYAYDYYVARAGGAPKQTLRPGIPSSSSPFGTIDSVDDEWSRHITAYLWSRSVNNTDQLRQRVVYALSQFLVVSLRHEVLGFSPFLVAGYMDMLCANAFGNFRTLIENVCRSPAMGYYLTHAANTAPEFDDTTTPPTIKRIPDQNFARELLQLFTLGLTKLNMDGTEVTVGGVPVPSLTATDVPVLSNVFTGWALDRSADYAVSPLLMYRYRSTQTATADIWNFQERDELYDTSENGFDLDKRVYYFSSRPRYRRSLRYIVSMAPFVTFTQKRIHEINKDTSGQFVQEDLGTIQTHSTQALMCRQLGLSSTQPVAFLGNSAFQLGLDPVSSMKNALDAIFAHQNLAPFVAKQMIQHLVTSNPSTTYVQSVATAFQNANWDMKVLIRAILMDTEARLVSTSVSYGRLKEPYLRVVQLMRAFGVPGLYPAETLTIADPIKALNLNHQYMWAPSVFNDFSPRYVYKGGKMANSNKVMPQMQICTETSVVAYVNAMHDILQKGLGQSDLPIDTTGNSPGALLLKPIVDAKPTPAGIVSLINLRLFGGTMSEDLQNMTLGAATGTSTTDATLLNRIKAAIFLAVLSTEYLVQR